MKIKISHEKNYRNLKGKLFVSLIEYNNNVIKEEIVNFPLSAFLCLSDNDEIENLCNKIEEGINKLIKDLKC